jgi:D-alanyl-D-alanine carboxypeptidase (penicillin-binding protein 5/6)
MKKFLAVFLAAAVVIAGVLFFNGQKEDITLEAQTTPSYEADRSLPTNETGVLSTTEDENAALAGDIERFSVDIMAANAYVLYAETNSALYQKNSDEHIAPASTAKMLTALTVLETCPLDDTFTVGSEIDLIASDSSRAWLNRGDKLTVKQLLVALLVPSGNDAAYTLAVNVGKKIAGENGLGEQQAIEAFVSAMNQTAKKAGAISSNFVTPDGYDANGQYTTAFDLAQIAKACLRHDVLLEIMGSHKVNDTWVSGREVTYQNTNKLIDPNSPYYYSNVIGLKTGHSGDAGSCLVSAAVINGKIYICVVMGDSDDARFSDSLTVFSSIDPTLVGPTPSRNNSDAPGGFGGR